VSRRRDGFTLLEVLIAVFVLGSVLGSLLTMVGGNLARLSDARRELLEARLAEQRIREIEAEIQSGQEVRDGVDEGRFEAPNDDLAWQVVVEPYRIPLPIGYNAAPASPLFEMGDGDAADGLRRVEVRVFAAERDPESARPFVILVLEPSLVEDEEARTNS
jgi:prepilin-type N-terminal cleavage/methylation domain-containing protein